MSAALARQQRGLCVAQRDRAGAWQIDLARGRATHPCGFVIDFVPLSQRSTARGAPRDAPRALTLDTCALVDGCGSWALMALPESVDRALRYFGGMSTGTGVRQVATLTRQAAKEWMRAYSQHHAARTATSLRPGSLRTLVAG